MIENQQVYITYIADGQQREWEFPYQFVDATDISLYIKHEDEFTKIEPSLFEFDPDTKKCTYPKDSEEAPVPQGDIVLLTRETDITQLEDSSIANFKSTDVERIADKLTIIDQELKEGLDRCIKYNQVDAIGADTDASDFFELFEEYADDAIDTHNASETAHASRFAAKQDVIEDLSTIRSNATAGKSAKDAVDAMGNIVSHDIDEFATAEQGTKADSAVQPEDLNNYATTDALSAGLDTKQDTISDLATIRTGASKGSTAVQPSDLASVATSGAYNDLTGKPGISDLGDVAISSPSAAQVLAYDATTQKWKNSSSTASVAWGGVTGTLSDQTDLQSALNSKQATISDLETIRSGAALGATAVQPGDLATVATSGAYSDLSGTPTIPTVDQNYSALSANAQSGVAVASAINGKADTDLSNVTDTGTSSSAGWAMPSSTKEAITVGASGAQYQAPANGWFSFVTTNTATQNHYTYLTNETTHISSYAMGNSSIVARGSIEAKKGDYVTLGYYSSTIGEFYFVYAEGSKSEAN